eukprot:TRINITY_DN36401_c0_g1_i1.p1 TRINITY_DN36401_c0_g1~~TRINITY_DN36401_c0_g1_i1.p1  ORF type:complete len:294 (-),score=55.47 TRINITY_DN36401_c0_g1_i1:35-853(-)
MVEVVILLERLFADEETKDVRIDMCDGTIWAHSNILGAASDALRGVLRHGLAAQQKCLDWKEHSMEVGRFFLRLLYTGTVAEDDWAGAADSIDVPLRLILGGLALAKVYQVPHLLKPLTDVLKHRLNTSTFETICARAIDLDVTELRRFCLHFAETKGQGELPEGTRVRAELALHDCSDNEEAAAVSEGTLGVVNIDAGSTDERIIAWENGELNSIESGMKMISKGRIKVTSDAPNLFGMYQRGELSPQVNFELAPLWGVQTTLNPKRRKLL